MADSTDGPQDNHEKCKQYLQLAADHSTSQKWPEAVKYANLALETAKQIKDKDSERKEYQKLAVCYSVQDDLQKSLHCFEKHLELVRCLPNKQLEEQTLRYIGEIYKRMGKYSNAIDYSNKALQLALELNDKSEVASIYANLGFCHRNKGEYHKSIECHERQLAICMDIDDKKGQLKACSGLGTNYQNLGKYHESIEWLNKALDICIVIGDEKTSLIPLTTLALLHDLIGEKQKAIEYMKKISEISRKIKDTHLEEVALCSISAKQGQWEKVEDFTKKNLDTVGRTGDKGSEARALGYRGVSLMKLGQYDKAHEFAEKQIHLAEQIHDKECLLNGWYIKGQIYKRQSNFQQAESCYEKALKISQDAKYRRREAELLSNLGTLFYEVMFVHFQRNAEENYHNSLAKAVQFLQESLHCWELVFKDIEDEDQQKISILETFISNYNCLTMALLFQNKGQEALIASERGRARALDDQLALKYGLTKNSNSQRAPILFEEIQHMASTTPFVFYFMNPSVVYYWLINKDGCEVKSQSRYPETSLTDIVTDAYSVLKVREGAGEGRLIESQEKRRLLVEPLQASTMKIPDGLLTATFKRCVYEEDTPQPLEGLYKQLIAPLMDELTDEDEIVIIPDGSLYTVPFAALKDQNGSYLAERKRTRLAPSLTSLKTLQDSPVDFHSKSGALVVGNPQVGTVMFKGNMIQVGNLPNAEREAKKIGELLDVKPILGSQATRKTIKHHLCHGVAVIHFAAHGTHDGEIFLSPPPRGNHPQEHHPTPLPTGLPKESDYILTMKDVQESDVRPQLVVLSCCHSGRGEVKADGVIGMTRAFLAAGARAVVASLWAIADDAMPPWCSWKSSTAI